MMKKLLNFFYLLLKITLTIFMIMVVTLSLIKVNCKACEGFGRVECEECMGWGINSEPVRFYIECACRGDISTCRFCLGEGGYYSYNQIPCINCEGSGGEECKFCKGRGKVSQLKYTLQILRNIPSRRFQLKVPTRILPFWFREDAK